MPEQHIMKRWTKEARKGIVHDVKGNEIETDPRLDKTCKYKRLISRMVRLATKASNSTDDRFTHFERCIIELMKMKMIQMNHPWSHKTCQM